MRIRFSLTRPLELAASGGIEALLSRNRLLYGDLRMEDGDGDDSGDKDGGDDKDTGKGSSSNDDGKGDRGFPENTPVAEMTTAEQAAYWKFQSRKHEATAKARGDYDDLKTKAAEADKLRKERETESEKKAREAAESARADERAKQTPRLVLAEFKAAAAGRIDGDRLRDLTEDLDLTKYLTDKGEVDEAKVSKKVDAWAPKAKGDEKKTRRFPDTGGGQRGDTVSSKGAAGAAEAERRFATSKK